MKKGGRPLIYLGADHGGYQLKEKIKTWLKENSFQFEDLGNYKFDPNDDYPLFALLVAKKISQELGKGQNAKGVLLCRTGVGMSLVANKIKGIRAVDVGNSLLAAISRKKNDANIISLAADYLKEEEALKIIDLWLKTSFGGRKRHLRRIKEIERLEGKKFEIVPAILEKDFPSILKKIKKVENLASWVQIDFADGILVSNKSFLKLKDFLKLKTSLKLEAHLMVKNPTKFVSPLVKSGFQRLIAQIESEEILRFLKEAKKKKVEVGLAVDLPTKVEKVLPFCQTLDTILLMGVKSGRSGQKFQAQVFKKISTLKEKFPQLSLAVDGGVNDEVAPAIVAAGADRLVVSSYLFAKGGAENNFKKLSKLF